MSGPIPNSNLVIQSENVTNLALGTLAAKTALVLGQAFNGITATFLAKKIVYRMLISGVAADEGPFSIVTAPGDVSASEATTALIEGNTAGPSDTTQMLTQDNAFAVVRKTQTMFHPAGGPAVTAWYVDAEINLGKGIPFSEGTGWQHFVYNLDGSALTTGAVVNGQVTVWGVWLRD